MGGYVPLAYLKLADRSLVDEYHWQLEYMLLILMQSCDIALGHLHKRVPHLDSLENEYRLLADCASRLRQQLDDNRHITQEIITRSLFSSRRPAGTASSMLWRASAVGILWHRTILLFKGPALQPRHGILPESNNSQSRTIP